MCPCNCVDGQGTMTYSDGSQYVGEFRNKQECVARFWWVCDGLRHGQGTVTKADGFVLSGRWERGSNQEELEMIALETRKSSCTGFGFISNTDAHAQCVMQLAITEEAQAAQAAAVKEAADQARRQREAQALISLGAAISETGTPTRTNPIINSPSYPDSYSSTLTIPSNQVCPILGTPVTKQEVRGANSICYYQ